MKKRIWTQTAMECYQIGADCTQCPISKMGLHTSCKVKECLPELLDRLGPPRVYFNKDNLLCIRGEKETGTMAHREKIIAYVYEHPGVTIHKIEQAMMPKIQYRIIALTLKQALEVGLVKRTEKLIYSHQHHISKTYRYWPDKSYGSDYYNL